ncbi:MAG: hypothetical protein HY000_35110 [Planctomycetes bacterium]|nr:hypothetical protein [Planctomycetota bacterium]
MLAQLQHDPRWSTRCAVDDPAGIALGSVSLPFARSREIARDDDVLVALDGELYDVHELLDELRYSDSVLGADNHAAILLQLYRAGGRGRLASLNGSFSAAVWDHARRKLVLVTDAFGTRPLYYVRQSGRLLFSSHIKPLLVNLAVSRAPNWQGLAQFFTFGHYLRDDTSLEAVRVLPAGAWAVYDAQTDRFSVDRYWDYGQANGNAANNAAEVLDQIDEALSQAVQRCTENAPNLGLSLSGGLDARTILGVMKPGRTRIKTLCLGMAGSLDHRAAAKLAELASCEHHNHVLDESFLADFSSHLQSMVRLTDGQYLSQCIVMPTLGLYRELGIEVLLRGHAGELLHMSKAYNYSLDHEALAIRDRTALEDWLWRHLRAYMLPALGAPLFAGPRQGELVELARQSLRADLEETADDARPVVEQVWRLFVHQRLRRETVLSLMKFRSVVEPRLPYLDRDLVRLLFAVPPHLKLNDEIQTYILKKRRPSFLAVPNSNTGAKLGAGRWMRRWATLRTKVLAKLRVPGYQPYERLGLWLRTQLAPCVRKVLLSEACLQRGVFDPNGVRRVVSQHLAGRNHTFLLMAMMVFEVGQRYLCDEMPTEPCDLTRGTEACRRSA